jgi:hypothetical protein
LEDFNLLSVNSIGISSRLQKVLEEILQKTIDFSGGFLVGKILGHFDKGLGKMGNWGSLKSFVELSDVSLSFFDFGERSTVHKTFDEGKTFLDGVLGIFVFVTEFFISGLGLISFSGGFGDGSFSISNELLIHSDEVLESLSFWVEGVLEMGRSDTESDLGISESLVDLVFKLVVLGFGPSVFFLFTTKFKVKVSDEVLESDNKFVHWSTSG